MTAAELLSKLRSLKIRLRADNGKLLCDAPNGALTNELRAALSERKEEILALLDQINAAARRREPPLQPIPRDGDVPLSFAQQRLWFIDQLEPGSALYNVPKAFRFRGALDVASLERSLNEIVRRHEVLRTTFSAVDGRPVQKISPSLTVALPVADFTDRLGSEREDEALGLINEEARRPFDLAVGPLLRAFLVRLAAEDHILLLTLHHVVSDGWSMGILNRELSALYDAFCNGRPSPLAALPVQYADFAQWQREWLRGEVLQSQVGYWKKRLDNIPALQLPTDRSRRPRVQSYRGARHSMVLADGLCQALQVLSQREQASLFMTLLAAFNLLLCRYSGQHDIVIGTPIAGRNRSEVEGLIGFFVNTLVLRTDLSGDPTFRELLGRVRGGALDAYAHQDLPFEKLVEEVAPERQLGYAPLSQVMFVFQNLPDSSLEMSGSSAQPLELDSGTAKFDLTLQISRESYGMRCLLAYDTDLFDQATIARMLRHYHTLLDAIVVDPDRRISQLEILSRTERQQLLMEWNDTQKEYPRDKGIHKLFEEQAERSPNAIAVVFEGEQLTYHQLNQRANRLANYLRSCGVETEELVGLCVERSLEMIVGLLGILKAGGAYLPLDPAYPKERLAFMISDTQARLVLTQQRFANPRHPGFVEKIKLVCLDSGWEALAQQSERNPANVPAPDNLAYVMYTSGSTGEPKGVAITHRNVTRLVKEQNYTDFCEQEVFLQFAPLSFDASTLEIWGSLLNGGKLVVAPRFALSPDDLAGVIKGSGITTLWLTSALFHLMVDQHLESLSDVKQLLAGGDVLSMRHVKRAFNQLPGCRLINGYGPTENTTFSSSYRVTSADEMDDSVPIGHPINNTQAYVLDDHLNLVPKGIPGELYVGGEGLARGYFNNPELTAEKFLPHPFPDQPGSRLYKTADRVRYLSDGNIEFLGRIDNQVKVRGFRIELGEIESVLGRHPVVRDAVVVARQDTPGEKQLVGYLVTHRTVAVSALRDFLKEKLPDYMIPSAFVFLDSLPLTSNGKVDRQKLPCPGPSRPELETAFAMPGTATEELVARTWAEILKLERVGVHDNFFELGGHSLLATQVISRLRDQFGVELPLRALFEQPTVAGLAERIDTVLWAGERYRPSDSDASEEREEIKL
jgi:aspartate racemase